MLREAPFPIRIIETIGNLACEGITPDGGKLRMVCIMPDGNSGEKVCGGVVGKVVCESLWQYRRWESVAWRAADPCFPARQGLAGGKAAALDNGANCVEPG